MKNKDKFEKACYLCEYAERICSEEYCMCSKKGVVDPNYSCRKFSYDPLKTPVTIRKIPEFVPILKIDD